MGSVQVGKYQIFSDKLLAKIRADPEGYAEWDKVQSDMWHKKGLYSRLKETWYFWRIYGRLYWDVREPLKKPFSPDQPTQDFLTSIFTLNSDDKAHQIFLFIRKTITYQTDSSVWKKPEYWQSPQETMELGTGDCEDQAMYFAKLCELAGIGSWRVYLVCGEVTGGGHCWPHYITVGGLRSVSMDTTYYPDSSHPLNKPNAWDSKHLKKVYFLFTKDRAWVMRK